MASLVLGGIGASIGSEFGQASIGWMVGSTLGAYLFGEDTHSEGPRLKERKVTSSAYGAFINHVYGTARVDGNIIWSAGIKETVHTESSGSKGGPKHTSTTYSYSCSFAVALCVGEIVGIRKIWADGNLIYNKGESATADELAVSDQAGIEIYTGSESQSPDPLIESYKGIGSTPAFRGIAYIVFDELQLEKYGNRIPNITCEIVSKGSFNQTDWELRTSNFPSGDIYCSHYANGVFVAGGDSGIITSYDTINWSLTPKPNPLSDSIRSIAYGNGIWLAMGYNLYTAISTDNAKTWTWYEIGGNLNYDLVFYDGKFRSKSGTTENGIDWTPIPAFTLGDHYAYSDTGFVVSVRYGTSLTLKNKVTLLSYSNGVLTELNSTTVGTNLLRSVAYGNNRWVVVGDYKTVYSSSDGINWTQGLFDWWGTPHCYEVTFSNGVFTAVSLYGNVAKSIDGITWVNETKITSYGLVTVFYGDGIWFSGGVSGTLISHIPGDKISPDSVLVKNIILDMCLKAEVFSIEASSILDEVKGYVINSQITASDAILPLMKAFNLYASEIDNQIVFDVNDGIYDKVVNEDDLAAIEFDTKQTNKLSIFRSEQLALPRRVSVKYSSEERNYDNGIQYAQRVK